jgi:hypothetical protein
MKRRGPAYPSGASALPAVVSATGVEATHVGPKVVPALFSGGPACVQRFTASASLLTTSGRATLEPARVVDLTLMP